VSPWGAGAGDEAFAALFEYGKGDYTSHGSFASGKVRHCCKISRLRNIGS
jgi:hypothetical protein